MICEFEHNIFTGSSDNFKELALQIFRFQYQHNPIYRQYTDNLYTNIASIKLVEQIPFLPISFFKTQDIVCGTFEPQAIFESSGTTQTIQSHHKVKDISIYTESFLRAFEIFYGPVNEYCILALLPSYLERTNSSLVRMTDELVKKIGHPQSGFYLYNHQQLANVLKQLELSEQKTLLIGVTFALLDFANAFPMPLKHTIVMETGGMKGRKEEMIREEIHALLKQAFQLNEIHSEYGMTELLSQAYSKGEGVFNCPPWMKILIREEEDPLAVTAISGKGVINIIDLANIYSCSFIATDDAGRLFNDGSFEVLGRVDYSDMRGCSLLAV
ncbi:MAG: acyl transferase [Chitinophagaceae bacterium]